MSKNYPSVTIDLETLGVKPDAQVLSISAIAFNELEITTDFSDNPKLDLLIDLDCQAHRSVDDETIWWWSQRDPEVQAKIFNETGRVSVSDALTQLDKFCWLKQRIWCQGPTLDITILTHLYNEYKRGVPWKYDAVRDSRTLLDLIVVNQPVVTHDSLQDCIRQIMGVQQAVSGLGIKEFVRYKKYNALIK